jgi:phage terminase small subunit
MLFIDNYFLNKFDGTAAYLATYLKVKKRETAHANAARLLANASVAAEVARRQKEAREQNEDVVARIRKELEAGAFANIGNYLSFGPQGVVLKDSQGMTEEMLAGVTEVTETVTEHGGTIRFKMAPKERYLELLMKYYGLIVDRKQDLDGDGNPDGMVPMKKIIEEIWGSQRPGKLWNEDPKIETGDL